jgi:hypothetical protein
MIDDNNTAVGIESFVDIAQPRNAGDTVRDSLTNFTQNNATMQSGTVLIEFTVTKPTFSRKGQGGDRSTLAEDRCHGQESWSGYQEHVCRV